jgi:F-type H+-transporting ATPase subunit b
LDFNATLIGQMITFAIFVWVTMKYVWPPLMKILDARRDAIATGLAQAEKASRDLELAEIKVQEELLCARQKSAEIIDNANRRASAIIDEAKEKAIAEGGKIIARAEEEILQSKQQMKSELLNELGSLIVAGASKVVGEYIDEKSQSRILDEFIGEV